MLADLVKDKGGGVDVPALSVDWEKQVEGSEKLRAFWQARLRSSCDKIRRYVGHCPTIRLSRTGLQWAAMPLRKRYGARLPDRLKTRPWTPASVRSCAEPIRILRSVCQQILGFLSRKR